MYHISIDLQYIAVWPVDAEHNLQEDQTMWLRYIVVDIVNYGESSHSKGTDGNS